MISTRISFRETLVKGCLLAPCLVMAMTASTGSHALADRMKAELPVPPQPGSALKPAGVSQNGPLIQLALLLDTSGSMKGLVDQARCQLWNAVSTVSKATRNGTPVRLEISVYQYGTDTVRKSHGALRQIVGFTEDLDKVSAALFGLHVSGGDEFCGEVILSAVKGLPWVDDPTAYKAIFIAGNESFQQGDITFGAVLPQLVERGIVVNSIFCQSEKYVADATWEIAAKISGGRYSLINHNHHLPAMPTPMDEQLVRLNGEMNETFLWYGPGGPRAASNQQNQDANAMKLSSHAFAARMSSKIGHLYHHVGHDLIDAIRHGKVDVSKMPESKMPESLQVMKPQDRLSFLEDMIRTRQSVRRRMADVISQRHRYLTDRLPVKDGVNVLGDALISVITEQAQDRGYQFSDTVRVSQTR